MKSIVIFFLGILSKAAFAQEMVQVVCHQTSMVAKIQKELVVTANYSMQNVHLNEQSCVFDEDDGTFFVKRIAPITSCGTHYTANDTHVVFTNSISTVNTGPTYPYGIVIGGQANSNVLSALISCTYRIDLNVSTMFIPNISITLIQMPDAFETGEFRAGMALYEDGSYRRAFQSPPLMNPEDTLYVGVRLLDETSSDIYLLVEECWGTVTDNPDDRPKYPLIENGCAIAENGDGLIRVTQNGVGHQAMWNSPVFKFVGDGEEFDNVWLHCDLQLCINSACEPTCPARKRRSIGDGSFWGPEDFDSQYVISVGPIRRVKITQYYEDKDEKLPFVIDSAENLQEDPSPTPESNPFMSGPIIAVIAVLGGLALLSIVLALVALILRSFNRPSNTGLKLSGITNSAYA